ncbi:hypothetical protein Q9Q99_02395 [Curtobacterium flaccumfaciens]|nr:hypothetical protein Q9Q99_02395 [Curtobacterium flaccumfaciens]
MPPPRLATANERVRDAADARIAARRSLADSEDAQPIQDAATLSAVAAARAATRGMLEELDAVVQNRRADADRAQQDYTAARRAAVGLREARGQAHRAAGGRGTPDRTERPR